MARNIKLLLVDDHTVAREGVRSMLACAPDIAVAAEASSGEEAIQKAAELQPDVILMDIRMPGMSGTEAVRRIKGTCPTIAVIMLTMYDSDLYVVEAIQAGAAGYLTKDVSRELLCHAVRLVMEGGTMVRTGLLRRAIDAFLRTSPANKADPNGSLVEHLTPREVEVLRLIAQGQANKEIASRLHLAEITVKKHVQGVIGKLGVSDRTNAALAAVRLGLAE